MLRIPFRTKPTATELNNSYRGALSELLNFEFSETKEDSISASFTVMAHHLQPANLLHGGALLALAETVASVGSSLIIDLKVYTLVGTHFSATHVSSSQLGHRIQASARLLHLGRKNHVWQVDIYNESKNKLCSTVQCTCQIIERSKA